MLLELNIRNFALIENLTVSFKKGLNILTGETGAGKSILIDAIGFVLGGKFNKDLIRSGEKKTFVEAVFTIENKKTEQILKSMGIEFEDMLIISRETFQSGKSIAKVNGYSLLLNQLKCISQTLLDIHGQHENQNLLDWTNHISYLDYFGYDKLKSLHSIYVEQYKKVEKIKQKIDKIQDDVKNKEKIIDFLKFQIEDLSKANLKIGEDDELEKKYAVISNAEKINYSLENSYKVLYTGSDESLSVYDKLGSVIKDLKSIEKNMEKVEQVVKSLEDIYYILEQDIDDIRDLKEQVSYDAGELDFVNQRIYQINSYKKKYGNTIEDVLKYNEKIKKQYDELINSSENIEKLKSEFEKEKLSMAESADKLHDFRCKIGLILEKKVKNELNYIGMEKSIFKIKIDKEDNFSESGCDKVQFYISTNPGEPLKPLDKIASGGELSRIMLALKTVFVNKDKTPSIIFDEIDTGISGRTAQSVAEKMYLISKSHQVLCITHLPQIACMSDVHYLISKSVKNNKTYTNVKEIDLNEKKYEIARMIGGAQVTELTLKNSEELIDMAEEKKNEISQNMN